MTSLRLFLHLMGVTVWVGGQIVLAALVPVARSAGAEVPRAMARRFSSIAWPFFALAVATGVWNLLVIDVGSRDTTYHATLGIKLLLVALSGVSAFVHGIGVTPAVRAATGAGTLVAGVAATYCGVLLIT